MLGYFLLFLLAFSAVGNAFAQTYPSKPVRLIVTYPPGAAGAIGMEFAARQPADGYRFVVGNIGPAAVNPLLSRVPYSVEQDFVPVSLISSRTRW